MGNRKRISNSSKVELVFVGDSIVWRKEDRDDLINRQQRILEQEAENERIRQEEEAVKKEKSIELALERLQMERDMVDVPDWESIIMNAIMSGDGDKYGFG